MGPLQRRDHDGIDLTEGLQLTLEIRCVARVGNSGDIDILFAGDEQSDIGEVSATQQGKSALAPQRRVVKNVGTLIASPPEKGKRVRQIACR